ncbi:nuclear receptor subfamily 0 group B member 2-like, partial [Bombina bombina]|uniref:nuclear receptor subfamily 0 group B member 2-like n=1 Tax=Bombina bombina TaxID=8345 RepID=UPI00235A6956
CSAVMACTSEKYRKCQCNRDPVNSILFQMLNKKNNTQHDSHLHICSSARGCPCEDNQKVSLKNPEVTCKKASEVLLKTVAFIRNVPSFYQLPQEDQMLLVQKCWAPLFVMGLAQDKVHFELQEQSAPSLLKKILLNQSDGVGDVSLRTDTNGVPLIDVKRIQMCLRKFWNLDICAKEYAYLKGLVLFNPDISGMRFPHYVHTLQLEAWHTLMEFTSMMHSTNQVRFRWMLEALDLIKRVDANVITELFFKPISGEINLEDLLLETLFTK